MRECWREGEVRAFLDRELAPDDMERLQTHLEECAECHARYADLAGRAARVSEWMNALCEPQPAGAVPRAPLQAGMGRRWAWAALAAAAGLGIAVLALPRRVERPVVAPPSVTEAVVAPV